MSASLPVRALEALGEKETGSALQRHGFLVLRGIGRTEQEILSRCDDETMTLFHSNERLKSRLNVMSAGVQTRRCAKLTHGCSELPLCGLGLHRVTDEQSRLVREQLHCVTDARAMELIPWPAHGAVAGLRTAVAVAAQLLSSLCTQVLCRLDSGRYEAARRSQAAEHGDPSVVDVFLWVSTRMMSRKSEKSAGRLRPEHRPGRYGRHRYSTSTSTGTSTYRPRQCSASIRRVLRRACAWHPQQVPMRPVRRALPFAALRRRAQPPRRPQLPS